MNQSKGFVATLNALKWRLCLKYMNIYMTSEPIIRTSYKSN